VIGQIYDRADLLPLPIQ